MLGNQIPQVTVDLTMFTGYANWTFQLLMLKSSNREILFWNKKHMCGKHKVGCTQEKTFVIWQTIWRFDRQQNVKSVAGFLNKDAAPPVCVKTIRGGAKSTNRCWDWRGDLDITASWRGKSLPRFNWWEIRYISKIFLISRKQLFQCWKKNGERFLFSFNSHFLNEETLV